jgi:hypothetical protein
LIRFRAHCFTPNIRAPAAKKPPKRTKQQNPRGKRTAFNMFTDSPPEQWIKEKRPVG